MTAQLRIGGNIVPYLTLFTEQGEVDFEAVQRLFSATHQYVDVAFVGGATGQGHLVEPEDLGRIVRDAKTSFAGKPVIAGIWQTTGCAASRGRARSGFDYAEQALANGADALVVPAPMSDNPLDPTETPAYIREVRKKFPNSALILYINPALTRNFFTYEALQEARDLGFIGCKDSTGSKEHLDILIGSFGKQWGIYLGSERLAARCLIDPHYRGKVHGIVGSSGNVFPYLTKALWEAYVRGDKPSCQDFSLYLLRLLPLLNGPGDEEIKLRLTPALGRMGIGTGKSPFGKISDEAHIQVGTAISLMEAQRPEYIHYVNGGTL